MFTAKNTKGKARRGTLETAHGIIETPVFMPIATLGAVKTLLAEEVTALGAGVLLANTYHLLLRPGPDELKALGGLHTLMRHDGPILTDSGGFQVFSLSKLVETDDDGVTFQSHLDGSRIRLTPESSMDVQAAIGSDIRMQFDDVAAGQSDRQRAGDAMRRSLRWAERSKAASHLLISSSPHLLFGIVQGGTYEDLRAESAAGLQKIGFDGYAIGGLSVGESRPDTYRIAASTAALLPADRPRYFMGGGMPEEVVHYVSVGIDMFDCVLPTRNARHGTLFLWRDDPSVVVPKAFELAVQGASDVEVAEVLYEKVHIEAERFATDLSPIDSWNTGAPTSLAYSRAYLRHLFRTGETLALRLATIQNLRFYLRLMEELRRVVE